jgi:hypothetical protein
MPTFRLKCPFHLRIPTETLFKSVSFFQWRNSPQCSRASSLSTLHDRTQTPHSVGLLWTSDQPDAETSTSHHTTLTTDRHPCRGGIRTHGPSKRAAADPRLRPRSHWDGLTNVHTACKLCSVCSVTSVCGLTVCQHTHRAAFRTAIHAAQPK